VDGRTDVYGLGATMYEVFCGRLPIAPGPFHTVLSAIRATPPKDPRALVPLMPPECAAILLTALEKRPEDRYSGAYALRDDLLQLAAGRRVQGRPVSPVRRWARRSRRLAIQAAALLVVAVGIWIYLSSRPAVVELLSHPSATVLVDNEPRGTTPLQLTLDPGSRRIHLERERFRPLDYRLKLERGGNPRRTDMLIPVSWDDRIAIAILTESLGYPAEPFDISGERGTGALPHGRALLPRGRVLLQDLDTIRFETSDEEPFPESGRWEFRRGTEVLHSHPHGPMELVVSLPFPEALRAKLRSGDRIRWGYVASSGEEFLTEFEVVDEGSDLRAELLRLDATLDACPASVRTYFRAQAYLRHGLPQSAYRETAQAGALGETKEEAAILKVGMMMRALRTLGVLDSRLGDAVRDVVAGFPPELQREWFR